jgi:predicted oxidoreductase
MWRLADWDYSTDQVAELIGQCLELGITTFDHADIYGGYQCETLFGLAFASMDIPREQVQLVSKCDICLVTPARPDHKLAFYDTSRGHILSSVDHSLQAMRTEYLDVLLLHRPDPLMDAEEVAEAFGALQRAGKVLHFGVSNFLPHEFELLESVLEEPLVTNQIEYSPLEMKHQADGAIDLCQRRQIRPMAWSPFGGGRLFSATDERTERVRDVLAAVGRDLGGAEIDQVALAWILRHPADFLPVLGSGKIDRIRSAVTALEIPLTRQQWFAIWQASMGHEVP